MDIEYWENNTPNGMRSMVRSWEKIDTGPFRIKIVEPEQKYIGFLHTLTHIKHNYTEGLRTIAKINGKYLLLDSVDRPSPAAESWKLPFDLIVKFQHDSNNPNHKKSIASIVPYTYTMSWYDMDLIDRCWKKRQEVLSSKKFTSSMFWAGSLNTNKQQRHTVVSYLERMKHSICKYKNYNKGNIFPYDQYYSELATTQAGIAAAGTGDFTHRDIELMSVGNAFFRKTFQNTTRNPRISGVHYYSIGGHEVGIDKTMRHFCEYFEPNGEYRAFTDEEWDKHREMSYNARKWWEENGSPEGTFNLFREILEENNIV